MTTSSPAAPLRERADSFVSAGKSVRVERFESRTDHPRPAVLLLHGSDGLLYRGELYREAARDLARAGHPVLLPHYFDSTGKPHSLQTAPLHLLSWLQAVSDAVSYAVSQPDLDANCVGLVGFSLGAYMALAVASEDSRVAAVVESSGGIHELLIPGLRRLPPVLILHGARDRVVPVSEAYQVEQVLKKLGVAHEMKIYAEQAHTFSGEAAADARLRARRFLEKHLGTRE